MVEWKEYTVADVISTVIDYRGKTPKKLGGDWSDSGYRALSAKNIKTGKIVQVDSIRYVSEEMYKCWMKEEVQKEDILITSEAPFGQIYYWDSDEKIVLSQRLFAIRVNQRFYPKYIYFYMTSSFFQAELDGRATGTTVVGLRQPELLKCKIYAPDYQEQKKIADILWCLEQKINNNEAINNNLEQQAVLLFKKWFIEFDNSSKNMLETRFGLVPESFKLLKNGELPLVVTDYVANGSFASLKANVTLYQEPNYAYFIRNTDLKSGTFEVFVDEHSYNFLSKSTLYGGEIIISNVGDVGSVFLCPKLDKPMTLGNNIIMLRPEQENLRYYLYIWFKWLYGQSLIQGIKGGSAQPKFNKTDFKNLPIFLPPDDLLEQFHQIVKPMFELIDENNTENQALTRTRDTILPRLMSGELDVSDIEI